MPIRDPDPYVPTWVVPQWAMPAPKHQSFKCPVCDGSGLVSRPPGVAGDQTTWVSTDTGPYACRACGGTGIVWSDS